MSTTATDRSGGPSAPGGPAVIPDLSSLTTAPGHAEAPPPRGTADRTPWSSSQFWLLQLVVLAISLIRLAATVSFHLAATSQAVEFSTVALFFVPVVYAALNYGLSGALFTAGWVTVVVAPRFVSAVNRHDYVAAWVELAQIVLLDALAVLVGQRVTAERNARHAAEAAQQAHLSAEALYRDLFHSNQAPILIVDGNGTVVEANPSARRAFGPSPVRTGPGSGRSQPARLVDMIGPVASGQILSRLIAEQLPVRSGRGFPDERTERQGERVDPVASDVDGEPVLYRPTATMLDHSDDGARMQIVFEDVTAETRRHALVEAFAARVVAGQEEERRHIAQELHDGPVQTLIHLCRQIDTVGTTDDGERNGTATLGELRSIAESTVDELRSIAKGLRPSVLDDLGLVASINQLVLEAGERHGFEASFGVTGPERRLDPPVELALFRIAQEALSNIERHAAAVRVAVGLNFDDHGLRLNVKDDGVGFDVPGLPGGSSGDSLGLPGMTERAHLINARIRIRSERGVGTTVDVWVPTTDPD